MGIEKFIQKIAVQTAIYWGAPKSDGYGGMTFADPIEIPCRWEGVSEVITNRNGKQIVSSAKILVTQDLDKEGFLCLGTMDSGVDYSNPKNVEGAYPIQKIEKVPMIKSSTEFVRTVYL